MRIDVLDKGLVKLHSMLGDDNTIARAARVSYQSEGDAEANRALIGKLYRNGHGTPFEHVAFTFYVKAPEVVFRQWVRHRIGSFNVQSRRYTEITIDDLHIPDRWRGVSDPDEWHDLNNELLWNYEHSLAEYQRAIDTGIPAEQARLFLPGYAVYSTFIWTVNARSLMNFLEQRLSQHAQWEIRQYARAIWDIFTVALPATAAAFRQEHEELFE